MGEGDERWKVPCNCDSCDDYYRNIYTNDENIVDQYSIMAKNRKTIGSHKYFDKNTKCTGDILLGKPVDKEKQKKKKEKKELTSEDTSGIDIKWTSENMIKTEGYRSTISAFDKFYGDFPNMGMKNAIPNILLYGPPGTGKSIAVKSLKDKYQNFVYRLLTTNDIAGDLKEIPGLIIDLWTELAEEAKSKGTRGIFLIDELGSIGDSRKTSVKSTKKLTETLLSLMDGLLSPGNISVVAAANDTDTIDIAILDRFDEWIYYKSYSADERINFLLVYTDINTPLYSVPMEDITVSGLREKLADNTLGFNGRVFRKLRRDYNWWYNKFKKPNMVTKNDFISYLQEFKIKEDTKRTDMDNHNKISVEKKRPGRQNIEEPAMPVAHIPTVKEMAVSVAEWTNDTIKNIYKKYHVKFEYGGLASADPELTREYNNLKKINDMKKEFDRMNKEE